MKKHRHIVLGAWVVFAAMGWMGCFGVGPGDGGKVGQERKLTGTYKTGNALDSKVVVFNSNGSYKLYFRAEEFQNQRRPDAEADYTVVDKEIIFKSETGGELPERGILADADSSFTWQKYPGETFTKSN